jgi:hypothetical protein
VTHEWTAARFGAAVLLAWAGACGGEDGADPDAAPAQDGAPPGDAPLGDASVVDCSGDHQESADSSNDPFSPGKNGTAERTGLSLAAGGMAFTVCGQIHPDQATRQVSDHDSYVFQVTGNDPINLRIEMIAAAPGGAALELDLFRVEDGLPVPVALGPYRNGYAMVAGVVVPPGSYWVSAVGWPPVPDAPIGYAISVAENTLACPPADGDPGSIEVGDTTENGHRGNDSASVTYPLTPSATEDADDAPEPTGLVLEPGAVHLVRGTSAAVPSAGDSYLDRDAYLIATGPDTSELEVRLSWADGAVDLDAYLFEAGAPAHDYSVELGVSESSSRDELMTLNVDPDRSYWLWVGAFDSAAREIPADLPISYDITLCPREHGAAPADPR